MPTITKIKMWRSRHQFATLIVNLMSIHLGIMISELMFANKFESKLFILQNSNVTLIEENKKIRPKLNITDIKAIGDYMDYYQINVTRKYMDNEGIHYAQWMNPIIIFCIGTMTTLSLYISNRWGTKVPLALSAIFFIIAFLPFDAININRDIPSLVATMFYGVACTLQLYIVPMYIEETSGTQDYRTRDLIQVILIIVGWYVNTYIPLLMEACKPIIFHPSLPVIYLIGIIILPESPVWMVVNGEFKVLEWSKFWFQIDDNCNWREGKWSTAEGKLDLKRSFKWQLKLHEVKKSGLLGVSLLMAMILRFIADGLAVMNHRLDYPWHPAYHLIWMTLIVILLSLLNYSVQVIIPGELYGVYRDSRKVETYIRPIYFFMMHMVFNDVIEFVYMMSNKFEFEFLIFNNYCTYMYTLCIIVPLISLASFPRNLSIESYVFSQLGIWTGLWFFTELWWWLKITIEVTWWTCGLGVIIYVCVFLLRKFFFESHMDPDFLHGSLNVDSWVQPAKESSVLSNIYTQSPFVRYIREQY